MTVSSSPSWGETNEALKRLWAVYWQLKDTDKVMAERYKVEVILPLTYSISSRVQDIARLEILAETNKKTIALERKRKLRWKGWAKSAFELGVVGRNSR